MRRARFAVSIAIACGPATASAAPWTVTAEGGVEGDTNVERVETGPGLDTAAIAAPVLRLGGHVDRKDRLASGAYALGLGALARIVADTAGQTSTENVTLFTGDLRWLRPLGDRPVSLGIGLTGADVIALDPSSGSGARAFRNLGADALLVLRSAEDRHLTLAIGGRDFRYKPAHEFDWAGPTASARLDLMLWQPSGKTRSLELAATVGFEARTYAANALANACAIDAPRDPSCFAATSLTRRDRYQRAGLELTWVGSFVGALGYQLTVIDSNSFGQSLTRHRVSASVTTSLPAGFYGTALATLQIDQFVDGLIVQKDLQHTTFTSLDDENRSTLQLRLAHPVSASLSLEGRAAIWRDLGSNTSSSEFHRSLVYGGAIYTY